MNNIDFKKLKIQIQLMVKSIEWQKLIFCIVGFLCGYPFFLLGMLCVFLLGLLLMPLVGDGIMFDHFFTRTTLLCFGFILLVGTIWKKITNKKNIGYYSTWLLFFFPTINAQLTFDNTYRGWIIKTGFDCLYPFGVGIISLFMRQVPRRHTSSDLDYFPSRYENEFNPDIFSQIFDSQYQWQTIHFLSLLFAVVCVFLIRIYFFKKVSYPQQNFG